MTTTAQTLTIADFLLARIAEDEAAARAAQSTPWRAMPTFYGDTAYVGNGAGELWNTEDSASYAAPLEVATHMARHDPARVLEDCKRKRRIVEMRDALNYPVGLVDRMVLPPLRRTMDLVLAELAAVHRDHPDYRQEWKP